MDFSVPPVVATMEAQIKAVADMCHQSNDTAALLIYPTSVPTLSFDANLKTRRRIEDRLMAAGLQIDNELLVTCSVQERHGNDRRKLGLVCRLCVSSRVGYDSAWLRSDTVQTGKLEGVPLMRVRDVSPLILPDTVGSRDASSFSANERASLKGGLACATMVKSLLDGMNLDPVNAKVILVDVNTFLFADWLQASWQMYQEWTSSPSNKLMVTCISFCTDSSYCQAIRGHMEQKLLDTWWFLQPQAGPAEPTQSPDMTVEKPSLRIASWSGATPTLPNFILTKFTSEDSHYKPWSDLCASFKTMIDAKAVIMLDGGGLVMPDGLRLENPDWSVPPEAPDTNVSVSAIAERAAVDFPMESVCLACSNVLRCHMRHLASSKLCVSLNLWTSGRGSTRAVQHGHSHPWWSPMNGSCGSHGTTPRRRRSS
jgi:hypothetical protein